jgi:hypothetical protein
MLCIEVLKSGGILLDFTGHPKPKLSLPDC